MAALLTEAGRARQVAGPCPCHPSFRERLDHANRCARYCRRDANVGTHFATTKSDASHLDQVIEMREALQIDRRRNMTGTWVH